ncbi:MAG: hypothetical protein JXA77_15430 [Bacteroidales bacterium]|nr:hypothetical protein [Bacteroidales bacterium]MBN2821209.1 hypothetical protein [Bacteroidales bacterium]
MFGNYNLKTRDFNILNDKKGVFTSKLKSDKGKLDSPEFLSIFHPKNLESIKLHHEQLLELNDFSNVIESEARLRINGDEYGVFQFFETVFSVDSDKHPLEMLGIVFDITEKKKVENELNKYQNHLEFLVQERTEELATANEELTAINEELYDKNTELTALISLNAHQGRKIEKLNNELMSKNETLKLTNIDLVDKKRTLEETLNKLREMQKQLVHQEKMSSLGILIAGIAHEINNPVNYINSGISGIKTPVNNIQAAYKDLNKYIVSLKNDSSKEILSDIQKKYNVDKNLSNLTLVIKNIEIGIKRIIEIINSLRNYAAKPEDIYQAADVHEIIESVLIILKHEYKNKVIIERQFNEVPLIYCNAGQINQVLMNLILNGIQSIKEKGKITISTSYSKKENAVIVTVKDTGCGIPENTLSKIFDPFFTTKDVGKGTGLGLSISYHIIQNHKGKIEVNSTLNKGTEFKIELPVFDSN